jgi:Ca2+-transporting ATPase
VGAAHEDVMKNPPRDSEEPVISGYYWKLIAFYGLIIGASVIASMIIGQEQLMLTQKEAVSVSFLTLAFARLWHVFNMRDAGSPLFKNEVTRNPVVWGAIGLCLFLVLMTVYIPVLADVLKVSTPHGAGWLLILGMSVIPLVVGQITLAVIRKYEKK